MPIETHLERDGRLIRSTLRGALTLAEVTKAIDEVLRDPALKPGFRVFSDHTRLEEALTADTVRGLAAFLEANRSTLRGARWAIVTRQPASFGMMRMLAAHSDGALEIRVFLDPHEAEEWLEEGGGEEAD